MPTSPRPAFYANFATTPDYLDPRITFTRTGTASFVNRLGRINYAAANTPRWTFDPITGECMGIIIEPSKQNSALHSEDFTNAAWTKTNCSVTSNSVVAPDGATTGDTLIASTTSGQVSQAVTTTAGFPVVFSVFVKAATSSFAKISITDGTNTVNAWFNLSTGAVGTVSTGGGSVVYVSRRIEAFQENWYRIGIGVDTTVNTSYTCAIQPTAADNTESAANNSIYAWGAQIEVGGMAGISSYIPTTTASVTRNAEGLIIPVSVVVDNWFSQNSGTLFMDWITNVPTSASVAFVAGGIGDTFSNTVYVGKWSTSVGSTYIRGGGPGATRLATTPISAGTRVKIATSWSSTRIALAVNGVSVVMTSTGTVYVPASTQRISFGCSPWTSTPDGAIFGIFRVAAYYPYQLTDDEIRLMTAL